MMKKVSRLMAFGIALLLLCALTLMAQMTTGDLKGKVVDDASQPIPGATIVVTGPSLGGEAGAITNADGYYHVKGLTPGGHYQVKVSAESYATTVRKDVTVTLGGTTQVGFTLGKGGTVIEVKGVAPVVDQRKTDSGTTITTKMINTIPLPRNYAQIAILAPTSVSSGEGVDASIGGASGPENNYIINGVDVTGSGNGTLGAGAGASRGNLLNFDFIDAIEVKTGGMEAEWGAATGGVVNAITKSGGNEFHGGAFIYYWKDKFFADAMDEWYVPSTLTGFTQYDIGAYVGGYFVKDKLWFFVMADYNKTKSRYMSEYTDPVVSLNGAPAQSIWNDVDRQENDTNKQYSGKLTWNINRDHKLSFSFFGRKEDDSGPIGLTKTRSLYGVDRFIKDNFYTLSLQWNATWNPNFFTEVIASRKHDKNSTVTDPVGMSSWTYAYRYSPGGTYSGFRVIPTGTAPASYSYPNIDLGSDWAPSNGGGSFEYEKDVTDQLRVKFTNEIGKNELMYGFQWTGIKYQDNFNYTGPTVTNQDGFGTSSGGAWIRWHWSPSAGEYRFRAQYFLNDQNKNTKQRYMALWMQDNWNITDYFMLKAGLRWDGFTMQGGASKYAIKTFDPGRGQWGPRLGFTWDPWKNGKGKVSGFWGRYYEKIPQDMAIRALTTELFTFEYYADPSLTDPRGTVAILGSTPTQVIGNAAGAPIKGQFNEEALGSFQYELMPDFSLGATLTWRSLGRIIEDISFDGGNSYIVTNPDNWAQAGFPKPRRFYKALTISADKRFSNHWQMQASYTWSKLWGNYEGLYRNDNGQLDPNITSLFDLPQLLVNAFGLLNNDRTHVIKAFGAYEWDFGLTAGGYFTWMSGRPISKLGSDDLYGQGEAFVTKRGSAGRMPSNWELDAEVSYKFPLPWSDLRFLVDIFNLTNNKKPTNVYQIYNEDNRNDVQTNPLWGQPNAWQDARRFRLALRWSF